MAHRTAPPEHEQEQSVSSLVASASYWVRNKTAAYDADHDDETKTAELVSVPASAKLVFVGARSPRRSREGKITIGAVGSRDVV